MLIFVNLFSQNRKKHQFVKIASLLSDQFCQIKSHFRELGDIQIRTGAQRFAIFCLTTWPYHLILLQ